VRLVVRPATLQDIADALDWYEERRLGLGDQFLDCVDHAMSQAREHPLRHRTLVHDVRVVLVKRFPYLLLYRVAGDAVVVVACFHARRDPRQWRRRR
jgi:plasmid stabilization system protein ParE